MSGINLSGAHIAKTTKLFINGEFPRTESGRSYPVKTKDGDILTHLCQASRKDLRNAVAAAQSAQAGWAKKTAYNRAQILYRMAEMLEGRMQEFVANRMLVQGLSNEQASAEVNGAIDALVYYAGFADKYSQVMASVNPVSGPFHNFTTPEPVGLVAMLYDQPFDFSTFMGMIASVICSGNTLVVVFDEPGATLLSEIGEVFKTSDLPAGVVNLLSGHVDELTSHMALHMEIQSILLASTDETRRGDIKEMAVENMKRVVPWDFAQKDLAPIVAFTEAKTIWHPVGL